MNMSEKQHTGELYLPTSSDLINEQNKYLDLLYDFNQTRPSELKRRDILFHKIIVDQGENCYFEPPFHANWGGKNVHLGDNVYANFNLTCVDDTHIFIGSDTMIGPNVTLATAGHPLDSRLRKDKYQYNLSIHIGNNCWIGAGTIIVPGITIGNNTVIGAGSVVTKDVPDNAVAFGTPCRVQKEIKPDLQDHFKIN
ncbi:maltose acetyltransferase [Leuconostoc mesenteroides]|nr:maltose acetyltransferase [Leuconostoc mesenteroides]